MTTKLSSDEVWQAVEKELFAVLGMVTARGESRTVGVVYAVQDRKLYIGSEEDAWKVRHIAANPHVSITIPIPKRVPFMPWFKIPAATITFSGTARLIPPADASRDLLKALYRHLATDEETLATTCIIEVTPKKEFITYGVAMPLLQMRDPDRAQGRAPVAAG